MVNILNSSAVFKLILKIQFYCNFLKILSSISENSSNKGCYHKYGIFNTVLYSFHNLPNPKEEQFIAQPCIQSI